MSQLISHTDRFNKRVSSFQKRCARIERQLDKNRLRVTDVELVYESSFLSVCSQWESLLRETLFEVVCGEESSKRGNTRVATFKNRSYFRKLLLFPDKDYIALQDLGRVEKIASLFVSKGRPFSAVSEENKTHIQQAIWVRNAIAHQSSFAVKLFREKVPGVVSLPTSKRIPGAFLRHEFREAPRQRRFELYYAAFQSAANEIAGAW